MENGEILKTLKNIETEENSREKLEKGELELVCEVCGKVMDEDTEMVVFRVAGSEGNAETGPISPSLVIECMDCYKEGEEQVRIMDEFNKTFL